MSRHTVRKVLKKHGLGQRKTRKKKPLGYHPNRDAQFHNIAKLKAEYLEKGGPMITLIPKRRSSLVILVEKVTPYSSPRGYARS